MMIFIAGLLIGAALAALGLPLMRGALLWRAIRPDETDALETIAPARVITLERTADAARP